MGNELQEFDPNEATEREEGVRLSDLEFTDLYIGETEGIVKIRGIEDAKGPLQVVPAGAIDDIDIVHQLVQQKVQNKEREFFVDHDGVRYRVSTIPSINGDWYTLRKSKTVIPRLKDLGGFNAPTIRHFGWLGKQAKAGAKSGLIIVAGATGNGKTTTACSLLREYLLTFGDIAVTIEDPPELILDGAHGPFGQCFQIKLDPGETFGKALVSALRYTPKYIFLGELRKAEDAGQALRAAISGHLVITTIHAGTVEEAINSMLKLTSSADESLEFAQSLLADGLAGVIHQRLVTQGGRKRLKIEQLFMGNEKGLRNMIRDGHINQISTSIEQQKNRMRRGDSPVEV
jgi:twitching motility protein PilT